jgi:hypothetical protein
MTEHRWFRYGDKGLFIGNDGGKMAIAEVFREHIVSKWSWTEKQANAHANLIASAPALRDALRDCITENGATSYRSADYLRRRILAINAIAAEALAHIESSKVWQFEGAQQ